MMHLFGRAARRQPAGILLTAGKNAAPGSVFRIQCFTALVEAGGGIVTAREKSMGLTAVRNGFLFAPREALSERISRPRAGPCPARLGFVWSHLGLLPPFR